MNYRFYLLDAESHFGAAESFCAPDDGTARETAAAVFDGCSDVFHGYELWRSEELLARVMQRHRIANGEIRLPNVMLRHHDIVLDLAERLQATFSCLEGSRRLLETTAAIREQAAQSATRRGDNKR